MIPKRKIFGTSNSVRQKRNAMIAIVSAILALMYGCISVLNDKAKHLNASARPLANNDEHNLGYCAKEGSNEIPSNEIIIDFDAVREFDTSPLKMVRNYTIQNYQKFMLLHAGQEHYTLLSYLASKYGDCRHLTDIGTRVVASALSLGSNQKSPAWSFDLPNSRERFDAFKGQTEEEWQQEVQGAGVNITFFNLDLLTISNDDLKKYLGTWLVLLDTLHEPDTHPFEREFFQRMIEVGYQGILLLDDIKLNDEMKKWWSELQNNELKYGYKTFDLTEVGHYSGTGLVDFSGKVRLIQ